MSVRMSIRLTTREPLPDGLRRIAREQLEGVLRRVAQAETKKEAAAVHATRKHIKKLRALLRLIREQIGREIFQEENGRLREVAHGFSGSRDARVQRELLEKLREETGGDLVFPKTSAALDGEVTSEAGSFGNQRAEAIATLELMGDRLEGWPLDHISMCELACGLRHAYGRGRKARAEVCSAPTPENFHTWRKRVKDIWYQGRILECLSPAVMAPLIENAKTLGQHLGDLHDLAVFRERLELENFGDESERSLLLGLICDREPKLEQITLDLGSRFFAEKPGAFERRLLRYADDWAAVSA